MRLTNRAVSVGVAGGAQVRRGALAAILYALFAVGVSAQLPPQAPEADAPKGDATPASAGKPIPDGRWWGAISPA
jgi:hypothetical protein